MKIYVNEHILKSIQTPAIQKRAKELVVVFRKELVPNELHSLEDLYFKFDNSANSETFIKSLYTLCGEAFKTLNFGVYTKDRMGAWVLVEDVEKFPGHIACSSLSKSEIVLPLFDARKNVIAVFDVDSDELNSFDKTDEMYLNKIINLLKF